MLVGILLLILLMLIFDFTGYLVLKNKNALITIPLGSIIFFSFFQLFALFFMVYHANFLIFKNLALLLIVVIYIILFIKNKDYFNVLANKFKNKYFILVLTLSLIFAVLLGVVSLGLGDSWLYGSLTFSSLDNNIIFSNNGVNLGGQIISYHYTDGIYLFESFIISLLNTDQYVGLMVICKAIEAILIIMTIGTICELLFSKYKTMMFWILGLVMILGCGFFTQYPQDEEIYGHLFLSVPMGINFFNCVGVFILLLTALKYINGQSIFNLILVPLVINAMFFFTSSSLFICFAFLTILTIYEVLLRKRKDNVLSILYGFGVVASYGIIYIFNGNWKIMALLLVFGWISCILFGWWLIRRQLKTITTLVQIVSGLYLGITLFMFFVVLRNSLDIIESIITLNHNEIYFVGSNYYFNIFGSIPILVFSIIGFGYLFKERKPVAYFMMVAIIMFANPIAYRIMGSIVSADVYHRIFVLFMPSILMMYGLYQIIIIIDNKINIKLDTFIITGLLIAILFYPKYDTVFTGFDDFTEFKYQSEDLELLSKYDFPKTKNVNFGGSGQVPLDGYIQADNVLRTRGDLNVVDCSDQQPFYIILRKETPMDLEVDYETPNYNVYYTQGDICQVEKN